MPVSPPIEPMLAKIAEEIPHGGDFPVRAQVGRIPAIVFAARTTCSSRAVTCGRSTALPDLQRSVLDQCQAASSWTRIVMPTAHGLDSAGCRCGCIPPLPGSQSSPKPVLPRLCVRSVGSRSQESLGRATTATPGTAREALKRFVVPLPYGDDADRDRRLTGSSASRAPGRRRIAKPARHVSAGEARDVQDQACAQRRLRACRLSLAQAVRTR